MAVAAAGRRRVELSSGSAVAAPLVQFSLSNSKLRLFFLLTAKAADDEAAPSIYLLLTAELVDEAALTRCLPFHKPTHGER